MNVLNKNLTNSNKSNDKESYFRVKNIFKKYINSNHWVLKNINIDINKNQILALVGESGSGKTTFLRAVAGLESITKGCICLDNKEISNKRYILPTEKREIGMVFQNYALFPHMNVYQNIIFGVNKHSAKKREFIYELLESFQLKKIETRYPHQLSGGQQQRVAIARSLASKPKLLLLDEPFSSLDTELRERMRILIKNLINDLQCTIILVTHDTKDALAISNKIAVIHDGKIQQIGTPEEVYFHSKNEYTASLFGKINSVPCQFFEKNNKKSKQSSIWLRPDWLEVQEYNQNNHQTNFVKGKVIEKLFLGNVIELIIKCEHDSSHTNISVFVNPAKKINVGDIVTVGNNNIEKN